MVFPSLHDAAVPAGYTALVFPHGASSGDSTLHRVDDGYSSAVTLTSTFTFFGVQQTTIFVSVKKQVQLVDVPLRQTNSLGVGTAM